VIDSHCHPFSLQGGPLDLASITLDVERDPGAEDRRRRLGPLRLSQELLRARLARLLGCDPEEVPEARAQAARDWPAYVSGVFADAGITGLIMDVAFPPEAGDRVSDYAAAAGCAVHPILRIDPIVDRMIGEGAGAQAIVDAVSEAMERAPSDGHVGFKTILAYRTGLAVDPAAELDDAERSLHTDLPIRRRGKACRDLVLRRAIGVAADLGMPFQIHTGLGDSELRLAESNPLLLQELLLTSEASAARIVLIHGSYPWHEEAAYLAATRPNVWLDLSLFNLFSPATVADRMLRVIDLAPAAKVMAGTDGHAEPELFWFGAIVLREAWVRVRERLAGAGAGEQWLDRAEGLLFEGTVKELYGI
jgi:hypothetical protein